MTENTPPPAAGTDKTAEVPSPSSLGGAATDQAGGAPLHSAADGARAGTRDAAAEGGGDRLAAPAERHTELTAAVAERAAAVETEARRRAALNFVAVRRLPRTHIEIERERAKSDSAIVAVMAFVIFGFLGYSAAVDVDVAVVAQGKVVGEERVQSVGSFDGGTVVAVHVKPYAHVEAGEVIIELDAKLAEADRRQMESARDQARADVVRLTAERDGTEPNLAGLPPDMAASVQASLTSRRMRMAQETSAKASELSSRERALTAQRRALTPLNEEIADHRSLLESGNFARTRLLEELSRQEEILGRIASGEADVHTARAQLEAIGAVHSEQIDDELSKAQEKLAETDQALAKATEHQGRTAVRSPVAGRIKTLTVHGAGGAIKPGDQLVEIIPDDAAILIEAKMAAGDAGHVAIGMPTTISLYPPDMSYSEISGTVVSVAPDSHSDDKGNLTHYAEIRPERTDFPSGRMYPYRLTPGVPVMVSMTYGRKSLFAHLFGGLLGEFQLASKAH